MTYCETLTRDLRPYLEHLLANSIPHCARARRLLVSIMTQSGVNACIST